LSDRALFIGNGFIPSQLLFIIPIAHGYCVAAGIKTLVFDRPIPREVAEHRLLSGILGQYKIIIAEYSTKRSFVGSLLSLTRRILMLPPALRLAFQSSRSKLLGGGSWYEVQLRHGVWDSALQSAPDGTIHISLMRRFISAVRVLEKVRLARRIVRNYRVQVAFLGHTVYTGSGVVAEFRRQGVHIYVHAAHSVYRLYVDSENSHFLMPRKEWDRLLLLADQSQVDSYWQERSIGNSTYSDARAAIEKSKEVSWRTPRNIIMMHVFRDSPFSHIDRNRVFSDYIEWIAYTLKVISNSREEWLLKTHPSANRWGENQFLWIREIIKTFLPGGRPNNVILSDGEYSNIELFQHAKRFVTYSGTAHLEAACSGIKPIVISNVTLNSFDPDLLFKPASQSEYADLLLSASADVRFSLNPGGVSDAKKLLHARERILGLGLNVGAINVYRGDDDSVFKRDWDSINKKLSSCTQGLLATGTSLQRGLPRAVNLDHLDGWCQRYFE